MTAAEPTYQVTVSREDNLWVAIVHGLAGGATDVERMVDMETEVRDLIAGLLDVDPFDFEIEWHYRQGSYDLTETLQSLRQRETTADEAVQERDDARRSAISDMREADLSVRAIAEIIGLSHQRVQQLAASTGKEPT